MAEFDLTWNLGPLACQPCDRFTLTPNWHEESCQRGARIARGDWDTEACGAEVRFCSHCFNLHHAGGWQTCKHPGVCSRGHPLCVSRPGLMGELARGEDPETEEES